MSGTSRSATRVEYLLWTAAAAAVVIAAIASTVGPIGADQTCFAYAAWRLLEGDRPGIELWEMKPPLHIYYYAAFFRALGSSELALLAGDALAQLLGMGLFAWGAMRRGAARLGITTALAYGLLYFFVIPQANHGAVEALANALTLAGCGIVLALGERAAAFAVAGCLFGTTFWTKLLPPAFGVVFACAVIGTGARLRKFAWLSGGVAVGVLAWWLLWAGTGDGMQILRDIAAARGFQRGTDNPGQAAGLLGLAFAHAVGWATVTGVLASGVEWSRAAARRIAEIALPVWTGVAGAWSLLSIVMVVAQGKFYGYHFIPFLLPMSLMAGICHAARSDAARTLVRRRVALGLAAALFASLVALRLDLALDVGWGLSTVTNLSHLTAALRSGDLEPYRDRLAALEVWAPARAARVEVGRAVAALSAPGEHVLYLDSGETAFWSRRPSYLRYFAPLPIQRARYDPPLARSALSANVAAELTRFQGSLLVWDPVWLPAGLSRAVDDLLARYDVVRTIEPYQIRVRKGSSATR